MNPVGKPVIKKNKDLQVCKRT